MSVPRRRRRRWPLWLFLLLVVSAVGGWWWTHREKQATGPEFESEAVGRGDLKKVVSASGELNPLVKVEIGSQISGTINQLNVDFNAKVKAGDVLCQLDPATYEANYAQSEAERASAEAERELQKRTLERKQLLLKQDFFAKADFDKAVADLARAEAQLQLADARLKKAKVDLDRCTIFAPIDGVIVDRTAEIGQTIAASFNAPKLFVLANDLTKMQINAKVSEADIGQVALGQKVEFTVDAYEDKFVGEVVQVRNSPIAEENVVNYDAIIAVTNNELKLKPGMTATVRIIVGERTNVVRVPNSALRFKPTPKPSQEDGAAPAARPRRGGGGPKEPEDPQQRTVYRPAASPLDEPTAHKVKVGLSDGIFSEVLDGLKEGEPIIVAEKIAAPETSGINNPFGGGMSRRPR
jgi:HlyD family secretion protein